MERALEEEFKWERRVQKAPFWKRSQEEIWRSGKSQYWKPLLGLPSRRPSLHSLSLYLTPLITTHRLRHEYTSKEVNLSSPEASLLYVKKNLPVPLSFLMWFIAGGSKLSSHKLPCQFLTLLPDVFRHCSVY